MVTLRRTNSLLGASAESRAQDTTSTRATPSDATMLEARTLFDEGVRLSRAERWLEALEAFRRSSQLVERPRTYFNLAIALDRLGRSRESIAAIDRYLALSDPTADEADRREAARMRLASEHRLATLTLRVTPPSATVEIDGEPVSGEGAERRVTWDPGDHVLSIEAPEHDTFREPIALSPGAQIERVVALTPRATGSGGEGTGTVDETHGDEHGRAIPMPPETPAPSQGGLVEDPIFWVVLGVVVVGVGVGVGVGVYVATEPQPYGGSTGLRF